MRERVVKRIMELTEPDSVTIHDNMGIIATVGRGMIHNPGTAARLFTALSREHVNVRMNRPGQQRAEHSGGRGQASTSSPPSAPFITNLWAAREQR